MIVVGVVLAVALVMISVEAKAPGRKWPRVSGWWVRALALNAGQVAVTLVAGRAWDGWMAARRPWSADALGAVGGAVVGYVAITFVYYGGTAGGTSRPSSGASSTKSITAHSVSRSLRASTSTPSRSSPMGSSRA